MLGRWQWRVLVSRIPGLQRRQWVIATLVPALVVWLLAIAPGAVDILAQGGGGLGAFKNGFIQAIVLGPLIGLSQSTALRDHTTRWMWWFAANVTTYLLGAVAYEFGKWVVDVLSLAKDITPAFPLLGLIYGVWMLWVTAPEVTGVRSPRVQQERHRPTDPGIPTSRPSASRSHDVSTAPIESLPTAERRRLVAIGLLRALATTVMVVAAYYLLPLDNLAGISLAVSPWRSDCSR